ncbi:MAG: hypothetical protein Fur0035_13180 [Anaerolineales bacterium]
MQTIFTPDLLKNAVENLRDPQRLDSHPWAESAFARDYARRHPESQSLTAGARLAAALNELFAAWQPARPPRRGKRLDTRWGEFGLLAAQYFAPFAFGSPAPRSLREAWQRIDAAILLFVFGATPPEEDRRAAYQLISGESFAANSTISDWHRKGLENFLNFVAARENHLTAQSPRPEKRRAGKWRVWGLALLLIFLLALTIFGYQKSRRVLGLARQLQADLQTLQQFGLTPQALENLPQILPALDALDQHLTALDGEVRPFLPLTPALAWLPGYGGDISSAEALLDLALALNRAARHSSLAIAPLAETLAAGQPQSVAALAAHLKNSQPQFAAALRALDEAQTARDKIDSARLSPRLRSLLEAKIDPLLPRLRLGLQAAQSIPTLLGAGADGPKSYLIVSQNEDELRPTGGYITNVGVLLVSQGKIISAKFEGSELLDDLSKPHPSPPWQLNRYMAAEILLLRDANWFVDFPTTAAWIEYFYAYTRSRSVDGVIAIDQQAVVGLLRAVGPLRVSGVDEPISAENAIEYMRKSKIRPPDWPADQPWYRKDFIESLAEPLLTKLAAGQGFRWADLFSALMTLLDEKHILLQMDDPALSEMLAAQNWNGQVLPAPGDFLMAVDANIGFSKGNAVVQQSMAAQVDLRDLAAPLSHLEIQYINPGQSAQDCQTLRKIVIDEFGYATTRCYGDYLRLYLPDGAALLSATPRAVPAQWTIRGVAVPAQVDTLTDDLAGFGVFGTYFVLPVGETFRLTFDFALPAAVLTSDGAGNYHYSLKVQKQPGTRAIPLSLALILPEGAALTAAPDSFSLTGNTLRGAFSLEKDISLSVDFFLPNP